MSELRTWLAGPGEAEAVARLLIGFRNWYGRDDPPDSTLRSVSVSSMRSTNTPPWRRAKR